MLAGGWLSRGVDVAAGGEVAALDLDARVVGEVVAGAAVARGGLARPRPSGRGRGGPGGRAARRTPPGASAPGPAPRPSDPADDVGADVGQVDQGDQRGLGVGRSSAAQPGPQRGAHALGPVVGRPRVATGAGRAAAAAVLGRGAEHHGHAVAAAVASRDAHAARPARCTVDRPPAPWASPSACPRRRRGAVPAASRAQRAERGVQERMPPSRGRRGPRSRDR